MFLRSLIGAIKTSVILLIFCVVNARSYVVSPTERSLSLRLIDVETNISPIPALFLNKKTLVVVEGLEWLKEIQVAKKLDNSFVHKTSDAKVVYSTFVNERQVANGNVEISDAFNKNSTVDLLSMEVGDFEVDRSGLNSIRVVLYSVLDGEITESSAKMEVRSYRKLTAAIPIILAFGLFLVFKFHMIYSLFLAIFIGSWIIEGSFIDGFKAIFDTYLLEAASDSAHVSILLFMVGISTLMKMVKRSGGTAAVMKALKEHSSKTRVAQFFFFSTGILVFFDPNISIMVIGKILGSILKGFPLSSAKVSFLLDTTAAPVASIFPKSTWFIFAGELVQNEIDKLVVLGHEAIGRQNGYLLILSSVSYQFYPCLVLGLAILQILTGREMGPILHAENRARLSYDENCRNDRRQKSIDEKSWNWYIPVVILNVFLWLTFSQVGIEYAGASQDTAFLATTWLTSVMSTVFLTQFIFLIQKKNGEFPFFDKCFDRHDNERIAYLNDTFPSASGSQSIPYNPTSKSEVSENYLKTIDKDQPKILGMGSKQETGDSDEKSFFACSKEPSLLNLQDGIECLVHGTVTAVPISLSLVFAWATGSVYIALGVDRIILSWILDDSLSKEILPITVFLASFLLSLVIGSSWCSISILIPGIISPLADSLGDDSKVLSLILGSLLSGAAAGDHIGPFSETTILSAIISGCEVRRHFLTQAPYALFALILSLLVGTLPVSYNGYPSYAGYAIGVSVLVAFVIFVCRQVDSYQESSSEGEDEPIIQTVHPMLGDRGGNTSGETSVASSGIRGRDCPTIVTQEGMEIVQTGTGLVTIQQNRGGKSHSLRSFKKKLHEVNSEGGDPILGLVEDGLLPESFRSELQKPPLGKRLPSINEKRNTGNENKKRLIEATIKKAEQDGNFLSESLRTFLRTAERKLGNIMDDESLEISGSGSVTSNGDDSLDNLMLDIAAKGWRSSMNNILGAETEMSAGEEYTTDGGSTLLESDDSATATSSSVGNGQSTFYTVNGGQSTYFNGGQSTYYTVNGQSTYYDGNGQSSYAGNGDATSCASTTTGTGYSTGTSRLLNPLEFGKSHQELQDGWTDNEELSCRAEDFSATDYTKASF